MVGVIEHASSGRAKCRACGAALTKDALRFGERVPNPFADGEATFWFHVYCGATKRPEPFLEVEDVPTGVEDMEGLRALARAGVEHHRLPRICGVERAASGRAKCRACREGIAKDAWRIALDIWEEGRFNPMGFIHVSCAAEYFGTANIGPRLRAISSALGEDDWREIEGQLAP